jgi:hypothetical protein
MYTHITCHKYPTVANEMIGELRMVVDAAGDPLLLLLEGSVLKYYDKKSVTHTVALYCSIL